MTAFRTRHIPTALMLLLAAISLLNIGGFVAEVRHWPLFPDNEDAERVRHAELARAALARLGLASVAYRGEGVETDDGLWEYFRVQYAVTPVVLRRRAGDEPYVLVNAWQTGELPDPGDMILVEDFGRGLALYRRP